VVPAFAGALRLSIVWTMTMVAVASAIWYGLITMVAFRVGTDWEQLKGTIARYGTTAAIIGGLLLGVGVVAWLVVRKRIKHK
ncbi:MAG TPA: hypothetical protein VEB19_13715, partial [Gemmatimonadaceae bacterium]|nr:hypothetical protein [Gemmatimonadaceae bacterium]